MPNATALAPVKPVPVTVTVLPPALGPELGDTPVTAGTGRLVPTESGQRLSFATGGSMSPATDISEHVRRHQ